MTTDVNRRGNGIINSAPTKANFNTLVPKSLVNDHGSSILELINPENIFHANHIANSPAENGNITDTSASYTRGTKPDIVAIMSENIWHDQQLEKKFNASAILTGATVLYIEKPAITPTPAIAPTTNGATAPAENGRKDKKTIQNFFSLFIAFKYIIFCIKCDIIEKIN